MMTTCIVAHNAQAMDISSIPVVEIDAFRTFVIDGVAVQKYHLTALFCVPQLSGSTLYAVLSDADQARLLISACRVKDAYPAITPDCVSAQLFEREIYENTGIIPTGHPWLKPVRFPQNSCHTQTWVGEMDYYAVEGDEIHEVAVGPVHAGVIEPGHFRFQCHGETVFHLEISLGYQHRDVEESLRSCSLSQAIHRIETVSGDATAGHTLAHCYAMESLMNGRVPVRAQAIRGIALELERLACHIGDLGAIAGDIGFLPTSAFCGRIRGDVLNCTCLICGNRFSRNLIQLGGTGFDIDDAMINELQKRLNKIQLDTTVAINLLWNTPSVLARLENTGSISKPLAQELGLVGPAARASGMKRDIRCDFAHGIYQFSQMPVATAQTGDVYARAMVRWLEIQHAFTFIQDMLKSMPNSPVISVMDSVSTNKMVVALTEGWRGQITHIALTATDGSLLHYKIIDPSFHNWFGLAHALRNEGISDFPLCNKSFNLSYCGFDL
ncbi:MAG: hydrogenase [Spartobacteria bacterium]|nr:hydrogenase [Spartobacteria bacterium]